MNRFWSKVDVRGPNDCWLWIGQMTHRGYGCFKLNGFLKGAHRVAFELSVGPIPDGMWVLHHCDCPRCVNPAHLFIGTAADNTADMMNKGRFVDRRGTKNPRARLTWDDVRTIRYLRQTTKLTTTAIGKQFGICNSHVSDIVNHRRWRHEREAGLHLSSHRRPLRGNGYPSLQGAP